MPLFPTLIWTKPQSKTFEMYSFLRLKYWQCRKLPFNKLLIIIYLPIWKKRNYKNRKLLWSHLPRMAPRHFRRYFRMYTDTLNSIISYLTMREPCTTLLHKGRICRHKKVAMTCAYLGSKLGGVHNVMILSFTFVNIFIKWHEIHSQNKWIIIKSLSFEHCHNCLEYWKIHF